MRGGLFGFHRPGDEIEIGFVRVKLSGSQGKCVYERDGRRVIVHGEGVDVLPHPAVGYGVRFLMVRLEEEMAVPPGESVSGYLSAPVDVSIRAGSVEVDRFTASKEKYALYGRDNAGVIARYWRSSFFRDEPDSLGVIKVIIRNSSDKWRLLDRIVVPIANSLMFYSPSKAYYPLIIVTVRELVEVNNTGNPPDGRLEKTGEERIIPNFIMRW